MTMLQVYPSITVKWLNPEDAPGDVSEIERAHVTINGDRMTIRANNESGRKDVVETLSGIVVKGRGKDTVVTGVSKFMTDRIGIGPEDAEVSISVDADPGKNLTRDA